MATIYTPAHVADLLGIAEDRVRKIVRQESMALIPDELRMVPGGRIDREANSKVLIILAGIFDAVTSGRAVTRTAPASPSFAHPLIRTIERQAS